MIEEISPNMVDISKMSVLWRQGDFLSSFPVERHSQGTTADVFEAFEEFVPSWFAKVNASSTCVDQKRCFNCFGAKFDDTRNRTPTVSTSHNSIQL